jgi:endonuclease YncB( thermonuclease family)
MAFPAPRCRFWLLLGTLILPPLSAGAGEEAAATGCRFEAASESVPADARAGRVIDGRSFLLEDGREVRLAGIEVPVTASDSSGQAAVQSARAALEALVRSAPLSFKRLGPESDRYGRLLLHVFGERETKQFWVQRELIARGYARVSARLDVACAKALLEAEREARDAGLGLWGDAEFRPRPAQETSEILNNRGRFALVEGKVLSVRESGGIVYLNFGRRWVRDFAVTVLKRNERLFTSAGMELKKLEGRRVRIRGWVEERGGPRIEAHGPEQIEIAERN